LSSNLRSGHTQSCGCLRDERRIEVHTTHGMTGTHTYSVWKSMHQRCSNPNHEYYHRYGGRGIKVCSPWKEFSAFLADMGECPDELTIERIDNDGDYTLDNCKWVTLKENARNRSSNVEVTYNGKTQCFAAWEEELGFKHGTLWNRINTYNWSIEKAMTEPVKFSKKDPVTFRGKTQSLAKHAEDFGLGKTTVYNRIDCGWDLERALTTPSNRKKK
jgi:hypothetical protein